jgi:DNA-binding response OmpR family regulator
MVFTLSDLTVNTTNRLVKRGGREISLTKTEFEILVLLLKHKHRVLTREAIIEQIWQDQSAITSHTLDSHITNLRQKLTQGSQRPLIHTVSGIGYRLT